jgi:hypothetical protein
VRRAIARRNGVWPGDDIAVIFWKRSFFWELSGDTPGGELITAIKSGLG